MVWFSHKELGRLVAVIVYAVVDVLLDAEAIVHSDVKYICYRCKIFAIDSSETVSLDLCCSSLLKCLHTFFYAQGDDLDFFIN